MEPSTRWTPSVRVRALSTGLLPALEELSFMKNIKHNFYTPEEAVIDRWVFSAVVLEVFTSLVKGLFVVNLQWQSYY